MSDAQTYAPTGCRFARYVYDGPAYCDEHEDYREPDRYAGPCESGRAAGLEQGR